MMPARLTTAHSVIYPMDSAWNVIKVRPADHDLTLIIPAYNEAQRLPWTLCYLSVFLDEWGVDYRVLVADDGSTDNTAALTDEFGPHFSTLTLSQHSGKGQAVKAAMLQATGRALAFTDADLPFDLSALRQGYEMLRRGKCQVVFGARDLPASKHLAPRHWSRQLATYTFRAIVKTLISRQVTDTQCGLKLFDRQAALQIFSRLTIGGFSFDAEVVALTQLLGMTYKRIPVTLINDYASTLSLRRNALPMLIDILRVWWRANFKRDLPAPEFAYLEEALVEEPYKTVAA
jgi:dolichyl-phosphate beta-glucosyltransferase